MLSIRDNGARAMKRFILDPRFSFGAASPANVAAVDSEWAIKVKFVWDVFLQTKLMIAGRSYVPIS